MAALRDKAKQALAKAVADATQAAQARPVQPEATNSLTEWHRFVTNPADPTANVTATVDLWPSGSRTSHTASS